MDLGRGPRCYISSKLPVNAAGGGGVPLMDFELVKEYITIRGSSNA